MLSPTRPPSRTSSGAVYLDRASRILALREAAERAAARLPEVRRIVLFGSIAQGTATPRSDADLLVEVAWSAHGSPRDRVPSVLDALSPLPCPIDLFVFASAELAAMRTDGSPLIRTIDERGIDLLQNARVAPANPSSGAGL
jgi:predicted nucleotidyltransferase